MIACVAAHIKRSAKFPPLFLRRNMSDLIEEEKPWKPPACIEDLFAATSGNKFAGLNAPTAGARDLADPIAGPVTTKDIRLYSLPTPNGLKVNLVLEELELEYDSFIINIMKGEQFNKFFVDINPNSKIPALVDVNGPDGQPIHLFESASIALYLCDKLNRFSFKDSPRERAELMNWMFFQMSAQGPMTGNFGHFFVYAPAVGKDQAREYGTARYGMEVLRICDVMEKHLAEGEGREYFVGGVYSLADMILFPWFHQTLTGYKQPDGLSADNFLSISTKCPLLCVWYNKIMERANVKKVYPDAV